MQDLLNMRPIERKYQEFYRICEEDIFDHPIELDAFRSIIRSSDEKYQELLIKDFTEILSEDVYFQSNQDIAMFQHYRYLPPTKHEHDFFEVAFVISGSCKNFIVNQEMLLCPGDLCIIAPHTRHAVATYQEDCVMLNILIRASTFERHFLNLLPKNDLLYNFFVKTLYHSSDMPYLIFKTGDDQELKDSAVSLYREYLHNSRYKNTMINSLLSLFFVNLMRRHEQDVIIPTIQPSVMNEDTLFILQYMQQNAATITLSHLAKFFNYSERQIQRIITTTTGMNFSENVKQIRMSHAAQMLSDSDLSVAEISELLGYCDTSNFRKVFKNFYNMTPQEYREKNQLQTC